MGLQDVDVVVVVDVVMGRLLLSLLVGLLSAPRAGPPLRSPVEDDSGSDGFLSAPSCADDILLSTGAPTAYKDFLGL